MFRNYFKIACRNLWRNKAFSAINIFGLSIGLATCLIILLYVQSELGYDRYNKKADRIVRVVLKGMVKGEKLNEANVMPPTAQTLKADFPEVQEATRLRGYGAPRISYGDKLFKDDAFAFADSNFLQVFTIPLLQGDTRTALLQPNSVVISRAMAQKYFGSEDAMGKVLDFKDLKISCKVTGVFDKIPVNSHFHFDLFGSMSSYPDSRNPSWLNSGFYTYLVLPEGYNYRQLEAKLPGVVRKYMGPEMQKAMGITLDQMQKGGNQFGLFLQPLTDIHLHSDLSGELSPAGDIRYIYIFGAIALFMLLIACINFMNLSTAGASKRAREVGIRKVMGSLQRELIGQFLLESVLLTAIGMGVALLLVYEILPFFNELSGKQLTFSLTANPWLLPGLLLLVVLVGALAGSYPAFFLSSFNPVTVLKGKFRSGRNTVGLRSGLVVFQFFISITLMVSTAIVYKQLNYIQNKKLGYDKDQVVIVHEPYWLGNNQQVFRQQVRTDPRVQSLSSSGYLPAGWSDNNNFFVYPENDHSQLVKTLRYDVDDQYIPTLGMEMALGRNFSPQFGTDSTGVILNETAARALGWGAGALGHMVTHADNSGAKWSYHVIGVVKDFHFKSMHERISPLVMVLGQNNGTMIVKAKTRDIAGLLATMKKEWTDLKADAPFAYSFLDDRFKNTYQSEQKTGLILGIFSGLTIFVACLGLFGLATFTAEQRTKEIGIRKVLGSSVTGIVGLLSKDFLKLVLLAFLIAAPLAWWAMNKWLQDFAYRIQINGWIFLLAALLALFITMVTISFQAIRAAVANPVKSLRSE
ncbi:MAG TPA: ABC transporter permease [Puia sp.]|nr:ABC transporter permease [Puia sp.]